MIEKTPLLVVSPIDNDHATLRRILLPCNWIVADAITLKSARHLLDSPNRFPVVICEQDLSSGNWKELYEHLAQKCDPPLLIVASRFADEHLWAEALNLGAHDVLAKPFEAEEVRRVLTSAWRRWERNHPSSYLNDLRAPAVNPWEYTRAT